MLNYPLKSLTALALVIATAASPALAETSPDGVEVVPLFLDDDGNGILRYDDPSGSADEFMAAFGGLSDNKNRPFEVMGALGGPWSGPALSICIEGIKKGMLGGHYAIEIYNTTKQQKVMRYRPVFDASQAEAILTTGEGAAPGECSRKYAP